MSPVSHGLLGSKDLHRSAGAQVCTDVFSELESWLSCRQQHGCNNPMPGKEVPLQPWSLKTPALAAWPGFTSKLQSQRSGRGGLCWDNALLLLLCGVAGHFGAVLPGFGVSVLHRPARDAAASLLKQVLGTSNIPLMLEEPQSYKPKGSTYFSGLVLSLGAHYAIMFGPSMPCRWFS